MTDSPVLGAAQRAFAAGDFVRARQLARDCLRQEPASLAAHGLLANASNALGDFAQAVAALEVLHQALPRDAGIRQAFAMACNNLGSQSFHAGDLDAAALLYERAIALDDSNALAYTNLAACAVQRRQHRLALDCYEHLLGLDPANTQAALGSARALRALGREHDADTALDALAARPVATESSLALALEFERIGAPDRAAAIIGAAGLDQNPDACAQLATMQKLCGNIAAARHHFDLLADSAARSGDARTHFRAERDAALAMATIFDDRAEIVAARADYAERLQRLIEQWSPQRLAWIGAQLDDLKCSRFSIAYQGEDDRELAARYGDWLSACAASVNPIPPMRPETLPIRRIGLICARWTRGTVAAYFGAWLGALRGHGAEVHLYTLSPHEDAISQGLAAQADHATRLPMALDAAAGQLREANLDLLIYPEIGLDPGCEVLAALRLAPRQWAAWGHPVTTGLPTLDRFISVAAMEPADAQRDYRETLALLPGIGTAYARPPAASGDREKFGLEAHAPLYLFPHGPVKLHPDSDELIAGILRLDGDARIVFVADETPALTRLHRQRLERHLARENITPESRLIWLPRLTVDDFRALIASADIVIDTLHFSGGATSLDVLAQNVPILTLEGRYMRARQTAAMLRLLDLPQLICADADAVAARAVALVHAADEMAQIRAALAQRTSRLFDQAAPLHALRDLVDSND